MLAVCGLLALPVRAGPTPDAAASASGLPRAAELAVLRYKQVALEQRRFDQEFPLAGLVAGEAIQALRAGGYACIVDPPTPSRRTADAAPGVGCERRSTAADDVCRVRTLRLSVDWQDARASADGLAAQLSTRRVVERVFRCE